MKLFHIAGIALAAATTFSVPSANAGCVSKAAVATADGDKNTKWFVMETMVQAVSWGLWPGFLANGKVEGYTVKNERYSCKPDGGQTTCHGSATFCTNK